MLSLLNDHIIDSWGAVLFQFLSPLDMTLGSILLYGCNIVLLFIHPLMDFWIILENLGFCEKTFLNINVDVFVWTYVSIFRDKYL